MTDERRTEEPMPLADETVSDLTSEGEVSGGKPRISHPCAQTDDDWSCGHTWCECAEASRIC